MTKREGGSSVWHCLEQGKTRKQILRLLRSLRMTMLVASSFVAKCHHRVHFHGATGGDVAREERDDSEDERDPEVC